MAITTLGHSTHTPEQFTRICRAARIEVVIDIRSHRSSHWDWWHGDAMDKWLPEAGLQIEWLEGLGGWSERVVDPATVDLSHWEARGVDLRPYLRGHFPKQRIGAKKLPDQPTLVQDPAWVSGWTNQGLHDYSWWTSTDTFRQALDRLVERYGTNRQPRCAIICSELLWWKCHRSMVADVLAHRGVPAVHLTPTPRDVRTTVHDATDRLPRYPAEVREAWA